MKNILTFYTNYRCTADLLWDGIELPEAAFLGCTNLKKVTFTSVKLPTYYVHAIKNNLFRDCNKLEEVTLSEKIYSIGSYAFMNCTALKKMILPKGLCYIKEGAFYNAGLEEVQSEEEELSYLSVGRKAFPSNVQLLKSFFKVTFSSFVQL